MDSPKEFCAGITANLIVEADQLLTAVDNANIGDKDADIAKEFMRVVGNATSQVMALRMKVAALDK